MFAAPLEGLVAVTQVTGIILVVLGVVEIVTALRIRKESRLAGAGERSAAAGAPTPR